MSDDKYPASFRFLPSAYGEAPSDNLSLLSRGDALYREPFVMLEPDEGSLGINSRSKKISTTIDFGEFYVLWAVGTSLYKIGISSYFLRRFKDLSAASPIPLKTIFYAKCDHPHLLEELLHEMFATRWFKNEWFSLREAELEKISQVLERYFEPHLVKSLEVSVGTA